MVSLCEGMIWLTSRSSRRKRRKSPVARPCFSDTVSLTAWGVFNFLVDVSARVVLVVQDGLCADI